MEWKKLKNTHFVMHHVYGGAIDLLVPMGKVQIKGEPWTIDIVECGRKGMCVFVCMCICACLLRMQRLC